MKQRHCLRLQSILLLSVFLSLQLAAPVYAEENTGANPSGNHFKFKDTDIKVVLKSIAKKAQQEGANINIVTTPEVEGSVTVDLQNVDWKSALQVILKTYDYGMVQEKGIITVSSWDKIKEDEAREQAMAEGQTTKIEVIKLKYIEATDARRTIEPFLSKEGKIAILDVVGKAGWEFGGAVGKVSQSSKEKITRTKVLVISDTPSAIRQITKLLDEIDVPQKQILIKARIMEVNRDTLKDVGIDWGTGVDGASGYTTPPADLPINSKGRGTIAGRNLSSEFTPNAFDPLEGTSAGGLPGMYPYKAGLEVILKKVTGTKLEAILHALEEDGRTNTLSAPIILTTNNQQASILVGTQFPIIKTETSTESNQIIGGSLDQYKDIGIQLNVIPQICGENDEYVDMIIHPAVTSYTNTSKVTSATGVTLVEYPIIISREAETHMMLRDGETVVMGGLLKDVKKEQTIGIPLLSELPWGVGNLFKRTTEDNSKIDLLIFITAEIVKPGRSIYKTASSENTVKMKASDLVPGASK